MPNTLTGLIPTMYEALDVVSREMVGFIPAVSRNSNAERAALNQVVTIPITPQGSLIDNTPGVTSPDNGDENIGNVSMTISKSKSYPIRWNGEDSLALENAGTLGGIKENQFTQAFRTIVNAVEVDLANEVCRNSSRATGTAGTTPFGVAGDLSDFANLRQILEDNGAPIGDLQFVGGSAATAKLRGKQSLLLKVNESGSNVLLRTGSISDVPIEGFSMHNSAALRQFTKGTGAGFLVNGAVAAGVDAIALDTGTGTVLAGDILTFAGDTNLYVNNSTLSGGLISLGDPGLMQALADNAAMTVGNSYVPNVGFSKSAVHLATRAPAIPKEGDAAVDRTYITDPLTGLVFEVALYPQFRQNLIMIGLAWGVRAIKSRHIATLLG